MKRVFILLLCLLSVCVVVSADEVPRNAFLLKVWNATDLEVSYLRFDLYLDEFEPGKTTYVANVCSTSKAGEDFYHPRRNLRNGRRLPVTGWHAEDDEVSEY